MALFDCPECNTSISDRALACPKCGYPIEQKELILDDFYSKPVLANDLNVSKGFSEFLVAGSDLVAGFFISEINPNFNIADCRCAIESRTKGLVLNINGKEIDIHFTQIVDIAVEQKKTIIERNKSLLGRAAVGGVIFGGAGAVVGALSGQNKKSEVLSGALTLTFFDPNLGKISQFIMLVNFDKYQKKLEAIKAIVEHQVRGGESQHKTDGFRFIGNENATNKTDKNEISPWDAPITSSGNFKSNIVIWTLLSILMLCLVLSFY
ncbi:MAG: zinc ribbon domain-containing protein [Paraglaciecola polaris]|uniref:zinc ribbon domain-containing protein n=1 Tax=Paraglaciecola polaris TaxID=222814 RepID=UPI003001658E